MNGDLVHHPGLEACSDCRGALLSEPREHRGSRTMVILHDATCPAAAKQLPDRQPRSYDLPDGHVLISAFADDPTVQQGHTDERAR